MEVIIPLNPQHFVIERETSTLNQVGQSRATAASVASVRAGTVGANATTIVEVIIPLNPKHFVIERETSTLNQVVMVLEAATASTLLGVIRCL